MSAVNVQNLPIHLIDPDPAQPRKRFDPGALARLAGTIQDLGIEQPIRVRSNGDRFVIIFGERRWRAAQMVAGLQTVPAIVEAVTEDRNKLRVRRLLENTGRENLCPIEIADAIEAAITEDGLTASEIAFAIGLSEGQVSKLRRLKELGPDDRGKVVRGELTVREAYAIARGARDAKPSPDQLARKIRQSQKAVRAGRRKVTLPLAPWCSIALVAREISVPLMVEWLSKLLDKARAAQGSGITLAAFVHSLRPAKQLRKAGAA